MPRYYVNKNAESNGDHEVHVEECIRMPAEWNREYLGEFPSCRSAVIEAKKKYSQADGCWHCSPACHAS